MIEIQEWPSIGHEVVAWESDPEVYAFLSRRQQLRIKPTYEAALPLSIAKRQISLSPQTSARIADVLVRLARFDAEQALRDYDVPNLLLRSESSASSQIEHLTVNARNVALAQIDGRASGNAKLVARNIDAMRKALALSGALDASGIIQIHNALLMDDGAHVGERGASNDGERGAGEGASNAGAGATFDTFDTCGAGATFTGFRREQVWIGGTHYSPHGAAYVPPVHEKVAGCIEDMLAFAQRDDVDPITKAAVVHAQFEMIHPFIDGNGRTGRTLLHKILKDEGVLPTATLPVSAGLLHSVDDYMRSLKAYQNGNPEEVVKQVLDALDSALYLGQWGMSALDRVVEGMRAKIRERSDSALHRLPAVLVAQPVVDSAYLEKKLNVSNRTALTVIEKACEYGILKRIGNRRREARFQCDEVLAVLDELSDVKRLRRMKISVPPA